MTIPEGFAQVNMRFRTTNVSRLCEMTFGLDNTVSDRSAPIIAGAVILAWDNNCDTVTSNQITLVNVKAKLGPDDVGPEATVDNASTGTLSGNIATPNCAYIIRKVTDLGGRRNRGRMYMPGVFEADVDNVGAIGAVRQNNISDAWMDFRTELQGADLEMVILHDPSLVNNDPVPDPTPITALLCESIIGTQRRRMRS